MRRFAAWHAETPTTGICEPCRSAATRAASSPAPVATPPVLDVEALAVVLHEALTAEFVAGTFSIALAFSRKVAARILSRLAAVSPQAPGGVQ